MIKLILKYIKKYVSKGDIEFFTNVINRERVSEVLAIKTDQRLNSNYSGIRLVHRSSYEWVLIEFEVS